MTEMRAEAVKTYALRVGADGSVLGESDDAGQQLDSAIRAYACDHDITYAKAMARVMNDPRRSELTKEYAESEGTRVNAVDIYGQGTRVTETSEIGGDLHLLTLQFQRVNGGKYSEAFDAVCRKNPTLARQYAET